ncbi:MAG: class I SAM-dependent methyltransferase [Trichocoleus desertorum ATA4-8-CV12]|jgi:SAM-dependent methyltransferase|nr:class I SAM-dependent methyltransferase [Trichocoleus desertorum ATA4-8-CV12]
MLKQIKEKIKKEQFNPSVLGIFINPFYFARKGLINHITDLSQHIHGKTLDIGCGQKPYRSLFHVSEYLGLEIDSPENRVHKSADYFYDGGVFPFEDKQFDSIVINQVFEHVFNPDHFLIEVRRVIKPKGKLLITVPFIWDEHEQPFDYARYSSFGLRFILEKNGFEIKECRKSVNDIRVIFQLINTYLYKKTNTTNKYLNFLVVLFLIAPFNIFGELLGKILPTNEDLYLDLVILAQENSAE